MTKRFTILLLLLLPVAHAAPPRGHAMPQRALKAYAPSATAPGDSEAGQEAEPPTAAPFPVPMLVPPNGPSFPVVRSRYAVLVDATSGKILWERNPDAIRPIASTTKMMTAILLLERGHLDDVVTAPERCPVPAGQQPAPEAGEKLTLRDLLYAMLLRSANDTAVTGAVYLSGSVPAFAAQMNLKAKEIGATRTHFVTPNGLPAPGHYSTAADLAKIACYALNNLPQFNEIVRTPLYKVNRSVDKRDVWVKNTATTFLKKFPGADGVKTGYIRAAGHCFVGSATRGGWRLVAVALDSGTCREDVESLLDVGFRNFAPTIGVHKDDPVGTVDISSAAGPVPVKAADDVFFVTSKWKPVPTFTTRLTPMPQLPQAPIPAGTRLGTFTILVDGKPQATGAAVAAADIGVKPAVALVKTTKAVGLTLLKLVGFLTLGVLLCLGGLIVYARTTAKSARRRRSRLAPRL